MRFRCLLLLSAVSCALWASAQTTTLTTPTQSTMNNQGAACSTDVSCTLAFAGGSGNISFSAVVGPNCVLGKTCGFPAGFVGSGFSYQWPDGSSGKTSNFSGVMNFTGTASCGTECMSYFYTLRGAFSGQDSQGRSFSGSTQQSITVSSYSRGGTSAVDAGGTTTVAVSPAAQSTPPPPTQLCFEPDPSTSLLEGNSLGTVIVGVADTNGNLAGNSAAPVTLSLTGPPEVDPVTQTVNAVQGLATFSLAAPLAAPGAYTLRASSAGLVSATSGTIEVSAIPAGAPGAVLAADPATLTVARGQSAAVTLTLIPDAGFVGTQTFACSGLPASATCSFSPPAVTADGSGTPLTTRLTITAAAVSAMTAPHAPFPRPAGGLHYAALLAFAGLGCWQGRKKDKRGQRLVAGIIVLVLLIFVVSCGRSGSASDSTSQTSQPGSQPANASTPQSATPPATQSNTALAATVAVNATDSAGIARGVNVYLTVTP